MLSGMRGEDAGATLGRPPHQAGSGEAWKSRLLQCDEQASSASTGPRHLPLPLLPKPAGAAPGSLLGRFFDSGRGIHHATEKVTALLKLVN